MVYYYKKIRMRLSNMAYQLRIDHLLAERRMSLQELAERIGMSPVNLSAYKTGKVRGIRLSTMELLCDTLRCEPGDLFVYVPDEEEEFDMSHAPAPKPVNPPALDFDAAHAIKQLREETGLTQAAFAKECGLKKKDVERLEKGDASVPIQVFQQIAARLGKHADFRFGVRFV